MCNGIVHTKDPEPWKMIRCPERVEDSTKDSVCLWGGILSAPRVGWQGRARKACDVSLIFTPPVGGLLMSFGSPSNQEELVGSFPILL